MALTATSLCVGALRKGPPMWPPAQPSVAAGQGAGATALLQDWGRQRGDVVKANPAGHPGKAAQDAGPAKDAAEVPPRKGRMEQSHAQRVERHLTSNEDPGNKGPSAPPYKPSCMATLVPRLQHKMPRVLSPTSSSHITPLPKRGGSAPPWLCCRR